MVSLTIIFALIAVHLVSGNNLDSLPTLFASSAVENLLHPTRPRSPVDSDDSASPDGLDGDEESDSGERIENLEEDAFVFDQTDRRRVLGLQLFALTLGGVACIAGIAAGVGVLIFYS